MLRKILLPTIFAILSFGLWISPDFKIIAAGVSIFLFGMLSLEQGFQSFAGGVLERILKNTTDKLWKSLSFGVITTSLMQSSSLVSVIAISFLSAGLIDLASGIGIIFGANIGTTTGAWLIAAFGLKVKISAYAMPMLIFGVILLFQKSKSLKGVGYILLGFGFLFLGISYMKEGFDTFKDGFDLAQFGVSGYLGLLLFVSVGILATVVMQSSHATLVLTITALATGQITYENGLALAIGANVGTTITAILGSLSSNEQGKRLAAAHLIFNLVTGMIAIIFIYQMMAVVDWISMTVGIPADDYTLKLAVFHTLFNTIGVLVMLPLINKLVTLLEKTFIPEAQHISQPKFLDDSAFEFPDTALEAVRKESLRVWAHSIKILMEAFGFKRQQVYSDLDLAVIAESQRRLPDFDVDVVYEQQVKSLYSAIIIFISRAGFSWQEEQSGDIHWLRQANQKMVEIIKASKHLRKNLTVAVTSNNKEQHALYNTMRVQLSLLIRELEKIQFTLSDEEDLPLFSLDYLRLSWQERCDIFNARVTSALSEGKISGEIAVSLLNDSYYGQEMFTKLLEVADILFLKHKHHLSEAEQEVQLDKDELRELQP